MYQENVVLCGCNSYEQKFYLSDNFNGLPQTIKDELKIMCVLYTEDVGGVVTLEFEEDGHLIFRVSCEEEDYLFDEIGSVLKMKQLREEKRELFETLEIYYKVFFLNEEINDLLSDEE